LLIGIGQCEALHANICWFTGIELATDKRTLWSNEVKDSHHDIKNCDPMFALEQELIFIPRSFLEVVTCKQICIFFKSSGKVTDSKAMLSIRVRVASEK